MSDVPAAGMEILEEERLRADPAVRRAAEELLWRRRGDAAQHAERTTRGRWKAAPHQRLIAQWVARLKREGGGILGVEGAIRHGKSVACSHRIPVWYLDEWPYEQVMLGTYEADFAASWGRKVRNTIFEDQEDLKVRLSFDSTAAHDWSTTAGGGMKTAGVGGAFTGKGGHLLIVDDPIKNAEEAKSPLHREKVWDWWRSTFRTRFEPGAVAIVTMARWHQDDLLGRLQRDHGGDRLVMLRLPGIAEEGDPLGRAPGEALWPERYTREDLEKLRESMGSYWFSALVQQRPMPREGGLFRRENVKFVSAPPSDGRTVRYWDKAATAPRKGTDPDWTAGVKERYCAKKTYILDVRRFRGGPEAVQRLVRSTAELDGIGTRIRMEQEPGSSGVESIATYRQLLAGFAFAGVRVTGPKEVRAEAFAAQVEAGNVLLVRTGDPARDAWIEPFLDELEQFPLGAKDDQVDAAVGAYQDNTRGTPRPDIL